MVWTVVAFDICLYTLGIIGERVRRADEIVLWLRYILSGYIKGLSDINNVLFWGSKEEWLRKINALKYTGKKICFKKVIKRCCGEYAVRNGMYLSGGRQRSPQKYEVWNYIKDAKVAVDYFILLLFSPPTPILLRSSGHPSGLFRAGRGGSFCTAWVFYKVLQILWQARWVWFSSPSSTTLTLKCYTIDHEIILLSWNTWVMV